MRTRALFPLAVLVLVALPLLSVPRAPRAQGNPGSPGLVAQVDSIEATEELTWNVPFAMGNPTGMGLYVDSMACVIESLDPGETRESRVTTVSLPGASQLVPSVSAGDSARFQYSMRASVERAHLTFRIFAHQSGRSPVILEAKVEALPGPVSKRFPSSFLSVGGRRVEYVLLPTAEAVGPSPALLLVHGHGNHARALLGRGLRLSRTGYTVMLASMPGYGLSEGPADFMGPATRQAMMAALDQLRRSPGVDSTRVGVWGFSRGATVAAELAVARRDLRCAIAQSGIYDLWAAYRGTRIPGIANLIVTEVGRDSAAWRDRSPLLAANKVKTPVLILHGELDPRVPVSQAHAFYNALKAAGDSVEARFIPGAGHALVGREVDRATADFLARQLKP